MRKRTPKRLERVKRRPMDLWLLNKVLEGGMPKDVEKLKKLAFMELEDIRSPERSLHVKELNEVKRKAFTALEELGLQGEAKVVPILASILREAEFSPTKSHFQVQAFNALKAMAEKSALLKDPTVKKKVDLARVRLEGEREMQPWVKHLLLNAIILVPSVRNACPSDYGDRRGVTYLLSLIEGARNRPILEVMEILGFDKVKR